MNGVPHPDLEQIERYCLGEASQAEQERIEEHLLICEHCRSQVQETDAYIAAVRDAAKEARGTQVSRKHPHIARSSGINDDTLAN